MSLNVVQKSFGWSAIGEISAKLISPVATIILARILTPADFGVVAVCNMVLFFLDIIIDAGFSKFLVQADFKDRKELYSYANVSFISTLALAIISWIVILLGRNDIAEFVGGKQYATVIVVTSLQMILVAYISPQLALLRRDFQYRKLCLFRVIPAFAPLIITVPLAYFTKSYWALIAGSFCMYVSQAIIIHFLCEWKPAKYWSWEKLQNMFSFSFWSLCEGLAHWLIFWIDTFILTRHFSSYYVGLYKNSSAIIMSLFMMVATAIVPVLFSTLSRIKNKEKSFVLILSVERLLIYILLPACVIIWFNRCIITDILLGSQWLEASLIVGIWAIIMTFSIIIYSVPAENFKAIGKPKYLFLYQCSYLAFLVPICYMASEHGFWEFVYARFFCVVFQILLFIIFAKAILQWSILKFSKNAIKSSCMSLPLILMCCLMAYIDFDSKLIPLAISIIIYLVSVIFFRHDMLKAFSSIMLDTEYQ